MSVTNPNCYETVTFGPKSGFAELSRGGPAEYNEYKRMSRATMDQQIRDILAAHGKLAVDVSTLRVDDDLFAAGLTSHASVNVMLACEDEFDVEFPDETLKKATFSSIANLGAVVGRLVHEAA